jgi:hypothetical protein
MGRKTIPLLLPQSVARWSLAVLTLAWTIGLITLWRPPVVASVAFAAVGLRCLGGYVSSYDEKDDFVSYCWYGVSEIHHCLFNVENEFRPHDWLDSSGFLEPTYSLSFPA